MSSSFLSRRVMLAGMGVAMMAPYGVARADGQVLRIGIIAGEDEDVWRVVAENAAKEGLTSRSSRFQITMHRTRHWLNTNWMQMHFSMGLFWKRKTRPRISISCL